MKKWIFLIAGALLSSGCLGNDIPTLYMDFENPGQVVRSYRKYLKLEKSGVESVRIKNQYFTRTVSLAFYLYTLGQSFEEFGRPKEAEKIYVHLLTTYPVIYDRGQLGTMTENRLLWLLGDKHWVCGSLNELILKIEYALQRKDVQSLTSLISHDFGLGKEDSERYAVRYQEGLGMISDDLPGLSHVTVEVINPSESDKVILKTSGWDAGRKNWYLVLHHNPRAKGWEWDMAYWDENPER